MEGPPEMVAGIVMNVMTSCSLRPASRARKPPIAWIPSCELPAMRMTASLIRDTLDAPSDDDAPAAILLIKEPWKLKSYTGKGGLTTEDVSVRHRCSTTLRYFRGMCQILIIHIYN